MVAAVQAPDGKIIAIQQTWLTSEGEKASAKRLTTGNLGAGAVRLGAVARSMGLAEGVETALSAMQTDRHDRMGISRRIETAQCRATARGRGGARLRRQRRARTHGRQASGRHPHQYWAPGVPALPAGSMRRLERLSNLIADRDGRDVLPSEAAEDAA